MSVIKSEVNRLKKKIFIQMIWLVSVGVFLVSIILGLVFYNQFSVQVRRELQEQTQIFKAHDSHNALLNLAAVDANDMRITVISEDGSVLFDNMASSEALPNHLDREEVQQAIASGEGESHRFSETLNSQSYYYAVRLTDGTILRTAKTIDGIWQMFASILPISVVAILACIILGYFLSGWMAHKITEPIGNVDFTNVPDMPYDELLPFAQTLAEHRNQIEYSNEQLQKRTNTINAIMNNILDGVVLLDHQGVILTVNKSATRIFDATKKLQGKNVLELWRDMDFSNNIQDALHGQRQEMLFQKDSKYYRVLISPASQIGVIVLISDITEKSEIENLRKEFSANVSHELKTPLTSIYGNAEMLKEGVVKKADIPLFHQKIMSEVSRLIVLIEDIIMLSKLDEGHNFESANMVNLSDVATECKDALEQKATAKQVSITIDGSAIIKATHSLLYELFYNLIDNAIKYNYPMGSIKIVISEQKDTVQIIISDTGIGIPKTEQSRIFERFYRVDKSRSKESGGTGLGLAIVKHIIIAYHGQIEVTSEPTQGTTFNITLQK